MIGYIRANLLICVLGLIVAISLPLAAYQTIRINGFLWFDGLEEQAAKAKFNLNECREGRKQDRANYEQAQRDAKAKNLADIARIEAEQEKVNAEAKSRYQRDLRRLRAGGLRKDLAAPPGSAGCAAASADGKTAAGADGENVCVPRSLLMRAAEIELKANSLIDWVNEQLRVVR